MPRKTMKVQPSIAAANTDDRPFWQDIEEIMGSRLLNEDGYMRGSMTGESWRIYLQSLREEILDRLAAYRGGGETGGFCASTLGPYKEERQKIERVYLRNLAALYRNAEKSYKTLAG